MGQYLDILQISLPHVLTNAQPTLAKEPVVFIAISGQTLCNAVSSLFLGFNLRSVKRTLGLPVGPEVMPLDQIVLSPASDALVCSKEKCPIVVLNDGALDSTGDVMI